MEIIHFFVSLWNLMNNFAFGIIVGVIVGVIPTIILKEYYRPQLSLGEVDYANAFYGVFVEETRRRSAALNCEVMLTIHDIDPAKDVLDIPNVTISSQGFRKIKDMNLSWARMTDGQSCSVPIYPGARQLLDFFKIHNTDSIVITSEKKWDPARICLKIPPGKEYQGEIKLFAENVKYNPNKHNFGFTLSNINNNIKLNFQGRD